MLFTNGQTLKGKGELYKRHLGKFVWKWNKNAYSTKHAYTNVINRAINNKEAQFLGGNVSYF